MLERAVHYSINAFFKMRFNAIDARAMETNSKK
jgi:hypothetical protein